MAMPAIDPAHPIKTTFMPEQIGWIPVESVRPLRMMSNYAFYDDDGLFRAWAEGVIVTDPEEIATLIGRKAPVERV